MCWFVGTPGDRVGFSIKKYFKEEDLYRDRESQIKAIEDTFEAAKVPVCTLTNSALSWYKEGSKFCSSSVFYVCILMAAFGNMPELTMCFTDREALQQT